MNVPEIFSTKLRIFLEGRVRGGDIYTPCFSLLLTNFDSYGK